MIECSTITGQKKLVPKEKLTFRISAYAVIRNEGKILVQELRNNDKYFFPGGGVEFGEKLEETLKREVMEETGIEIEVEKLLHTTETFFYYEPENAAWQCYSFFYICRPLTFKLLAHEEVDDYEARCSKWVELSGLKKEDFKDPADEVFQLL